MKFLISVIVVILAVIFAIDSSMSAAIPESAEKKDDNVIVLEVPLSSSDAKKIKIEGDRFFLEGKNFSSLEEMLNILEEEKKGRSSDPDASTPEPYSIAVPIARNFSSLKELFEILKEDETTLHLTNSSTNQSYVQGPEAKLSDYMIFFTS